MKEKPYLATADLKLGAFGVCETVIVDVYGQVSLINIFDRLHIPELSSQWPFYIFFVVHPTPGKHQLRFTMQKAGQLDEHEIDRFDIHIEPTIHTHTHTLHVDSLFSEYGDYVFYGYLDGEKIGISYLTLSPQPRKKS